MVEISKQIEKRYRCTKCGHISIKVTNHFEATWSWGHVNCCPDCPPHAKFPEYGGQTIWECLDTPDMVPVNLKYCLLCAKYHREDSKYRCSDPDDSFSSLQDAAIKLNTMVKYV